MGAKLIRQVFSPKAAAENGSGISEFTCFGKETA